MIKLKGNPVFGGISTGKIVFVKKRDTVVTKHEVEDSQLEIEKYENAKVCAIEELQKLYEESVESLGKEDAGIFLIQQMIIKDGQFNKSVKSLILDKKLNADYAVAHTARNFSQMLGGIDSEYMNSRAADLKDISDRLVKHILNLSETKINLNEKVIICAEDMMPSETAQLDRNNVLALCTKYGSTTSHTSILARTMNITSITGIGGELLESYDGKTAMVDGYSGTLYIEPTKETHHRLMKKEEAEAKKRELLKRLRGRKNITLDKTEVAVHANVRNLSGVEAAIKNDAGGIGVFRSEYLYYENDGFPNEEIQFYNYRRVVEQMKGKPVAIRTLDIWTDQSSDYFGLPVENKSNIGLRSISISLNNPEKFKTNLRALLRASAYGRLSIMIPMVVDREEVGQVKALIEEVKHELRIKGQPYRDDVKLGIVIETPAAVMLSDFLAEEADFFSIGTNDLEQYTLIADREKSAYDHITPSHHIALLRMISLVCKNAHRAGIKVGICGELGADITLTEAFLSMGIDEISVDPSNILPLRRKIRTLNLSDKKQILMKYGIT